MTLANAEANHVDGDAVIERDADAVKIEVVDGRALVRAREGTEATAELQWLDETVRVVLFGEPVEGTSCRVPPDAALVVEPISLDPRNEYRVDVSRDRMEATLRIVQHPGTRRSLRDQPPDSVVKLHVDEERVDAEPPTLSEALAALQEAGVVFGLDSDAVAACVDEPGSETVVATGLEPVEGQSGYLEHLVDFEALRLSGVLEGTPLVKRIPKRDGEPGRDVTGRELGVAVVKDARMRAGNGVVFEEDGNVAIAAVDGAPRCDGDGLVEVRHELVLRAVDTISGDVTFTGSVRIDGDVGEGRSVVARDELHVHGNVDRARLESGGSMTIGGSIMSSVLRAGGERAVAATIADRVLALPRVLGLTAAQARQFRDTGAARGSEISHGLSVQLVLENVQRGVLGDIASVVRDLRDAGNAHAAVADRVERWQRLLATAANNGLTVDRYQEILVEVGALASDVQRAFETPSNLVVSYMQASEAEATGTVTLTGKGIFNSRIVAWGGMEAKHLEAVFRGGSIVSHGRVHVHEVGSPAGAKTVVQLGTGASLESDRAYAGTVISGPGYSHRFVADRSHIRVGFDSDGGMNVESLAA